MRSLRPLDEFELTGRRRSHVIDGMQPRCTLQQDAMNAFLAMRTAASAAGLELSAASSFRDFDRQLSIWNAKYRGERPLVDRSGRELEAAALGPAERIEAILAWSALPGASRHHWGTDLDVFDAAALPDGVSLQLTPKEYSPAGPFARLGAWLDGNMHRFGFYRPYVTAGPGVSPEPWHLSFAPLAELCLAALTPALLARVLAESALEGREAVLASLPDLHRRFVAGIDPPPALSLAYEFRDHGRVV
jgi:LAS superfamily LD-carboxypeptidase LdcB